MRHHLMLAVTLAFVAGLVPAVASTSANSSGVSVTLDDARSFQPTTYRVRFTTRSALAAGDTVTFTAPLGTDFFLESVLYQVSVTGQPAIPAAAIKVTTTGPPANANAYMGNQATITLGEAIGANTPVEVDAASVSNPGPMPAAQLTVATSKSLTPSPSAPYAVTGPGAATWGTFTNAAGTRAYMLYQPSNWQATRALIVDLPGCTETSTLEAQWSRFPALAAQFGFSVLFPEQDSADNGGSCWNWFKSSNWSRGAGEPSILADLTRQIVTQQGFDPTRVSITGISAGGIMSNIVAVTYPDVYAAVGIYAGCEYQGLPCIGAPAAQPPFVSAQAAAAQMGPRLRVVPAIAVHGDADELVPAPNGLQAVQQWLATDALASGQALPVTPALPTSTSDYQQPGKQDATILTWRQGDSTIAEEIVVHGMAHQWADAPDGGTPEDHAITDPGGPDVTMPLAEFLLAATCPVCRY